MTKMPYHQVVANQIIESLKAGTTPWLKPWEPGIGNGQVPYNPITGKRYRGINALYLMLNQNDDNRWLTYKQAQSMDAQVRKGEKGTTIQYWKFHEEQTKLDDAGKPVLDEHGNPLKVQVNIERPKVFYATVFHASQIDNMPELIAKEPDWSLIERAEKLLHNSGANIEHSEADRAFYRLSTDSIHLPPKEQFKSAANYYATALHELGHWSGHPSRLDRDLGHPFGSDAYAKEELRAEIASMLLGAELGIGHDPSQHTAYIKSWIRVLEDEPLEIFRASADAEKIINHLCALEQTQDIQLTELIEIKDDQPKEEVFMASENTTSEKVWLSIPFKQKEIAKSTIGKLSDGTPGIAWDKVRKCWYANPGVPVEKIKAWLPENQILTQAQDKALIPEDEFKAALMSLGAIVSGGHPIMDGKPHRIVTEGDKNGEKAGFYVAHLDGIPAGYIKNNRTGAELNWKCKGYILTDEQKATLKAEALEHQQTRQRELEVKQKSTALRLKQKLSMMIEVVEPTPYMQNKGIQVHSGIYTDEERKLTCIPATDCEGSIWTVQYISEDGTKRFAKDSKKEGCFHVLGGMDKLSDAPVIIIAEGYATAATIKEACELPAVVSAFDSGNLKAVAKALHKKYPHTPVILAADDDKHLELSKGINPGKEKAGEAADAVNGFIVLPTFAPGEQSLNPRQFSDFNDLAKHSKLGIEGVKRQIKPKVDRIAKRYNLLRQPQRSNIVHISYG
ncbi:MULTISPECIES: zincin-like metallopeptidase domain-containing protein [Legionella]|uniref:DNA primase traC n=1 Tax=Legionella jamestowniensis TaxID=455 RepID=A0A0W0UKF3_9GAMM|nr:MULTISPECIES: zincin-like metallopeptidase domain-containing protein [Legionella]AOW51166.1 DNA primase [Legionella pneumophila subsp. pneumophila]AOW55232.1 DNA primase [Legionella pneumophila subsp. pneumophila]AOW64673.1 DNA primase [Legionella pneumophila subsp. pneumophila]KTD08371.1 DNA primase traC [Legionella jamestowniensis]CZI70359.1 DNA primase TraC [Legionella pneumophila]